MGAYRGIGAAQGSNVEKGGKIRSGGLHEVLGLSSVVSSSSDGEDDSFFLQFFCTFFFLFFSHGVGAKYRHFLATVFFFFGRSPAQGNARKKIEEKVSPRKTSKISMKSSPKASDTENLRPV